MPLSKARDKARKHKERAKIRLDKALFALGESKPVQPKVLIKPSIDQFNEGYALFGKPELDADGNPIPELT